eukprot:gnl/TRDRNA2_/TRDRNA2_74585_c0_seq1.p1 gnl/TRDRNA2_/TRDRNA2_74585_c0~~gnl/TRDRNA2_/TRDRNA2_74585_c0_seq1.p1  ORF type:complete len:141 (-),score=21.86 gnl/TRDRNA2_/TRDRNA2_74585_c0_seq1:154-576(-)
MPEAGSIVIEGGRAASVRSRGTHSRSAKNSQGSQRNGSSTPREKTPLVVTPRKARFQGECVCGSKEGATGGACQCKEVLHNVYSSSVYAALNSRGGALWVRQLKQIKADHGIDQKMQTWAAASDSAENRKPDEEGKKEAD